MFPMMTMWDDHESANDSWQGGAQNHQPESEGPGPSARRRRCAPIANGCRSSDDTWESYEIGDLATLFRPETRLTARTQPLGYLRRSSGTSRDRAGRACRAFATARGSDPARTLMGAEQEAWLADGLRRSVGQGTKWQVLAQQVVMGHARFAAAGGGLADARRRRAELRLQVQIGIAAGRARPAVHARQLGRLSGGAAAAARARRSTPMPIWSSSRATATMPGRSISIWMGHRAGRRVRRARASPPGAMKAICHGSSGRDGRARWSASIRS